MGVDTPSRGCQPVSFDLPMLRARRYATDDIARDVVGRLLRPMLVLLGVLIVLAGILIAPLPGPGGLPVIVLGLMLVLRNSFKARRHFVKFQRAHPKMVFPIRRLLRREPEVLAVAWQQTLRIERLILPARFRVCVKMRRRVRRRFRNAGEG
jgi:predicted membrane chloride channel (bestrophin family)